MKRIERIGKRGPRNGNRGRAEHRDMGKGTWDRGQWIGQMWRKTEDWIHGDKVKANSVIRTDNRGRGRRSEIGVRGQGTVTCVRD